jgi:hypothetical protein
MFELESNMCVLNYLCVCVSGLSMFDVRIIYVCVLQLSGLSFGNLGVCCNYLSSFENLCVTY